LFVVFAAEMQPNEFAVEVKRDPLIDGGRFEHSLKLI
jgi:hypothetical protein